MRHDIVKKEALELVPYIKLKNMLTDPDGDGPCVSLSELIPAGWQLVCKYAVASSKSVGALVKSDSGSFAILDYESAVSVRNDVAKSFLDKLSPALRCN